MPYRPKNSSHWHYDFQIRGRRFHGSCGTTDFEEAKAVEAQARVAAKGSSTVTGRYTLAEALGTYWTDVCQHQSSARTAKSQATMILETMDGRKPMSDISNADLARFVALRRAQVSNATVNRHLQMLSRALKYMHRVHRAKMPDIDLKSAETPEPIERIRELSQDEQTRLLEHLRPDLHAFVKFALMTGARLSTITELRWSDIDHTTRRMTFRLKGGTSMPFPISPEIAALLSALPKSELPEHRRFVFTFQVQNRRGNPRRKIVPNGGGLMEDFRAALEAAEIENFRFHDLRHTFATRLLRRTGNLKLVSRLLGHTSVETTTRYAHVLDNDLQDALDGFSVLKSTESRSNSRRKNKC